MNSVLFFQEFLNCESLFGGWLLLWVLGKPSADRLSGNADEFLESAAPSSLWFTLERKRIDVGDEKRLDRVRCCSQRTDRGNQRIARTSHMKKNEYKKYDRLGGAIWKNSDYAIVGKFLDNGLVLFTYAGGDAATVSDEFSGGAMTLEEAKDACEAHRRASRKTRPKQPGAQAELEASWRDSEAHGRDDAP